MRAAAALSMASFKGVIDKDGRHYSLIPLVECKEALEYTIPSFSVITVDVRRVRYQVILEGGSAAIVDGFIKDIEELNTRIFPTRIAVELSSNNACLVQVKAKVFFISILCCVPISGFCFTKRWMSWKRVLSILLH